MNSKKSIVGGVGVFFGAFRKTIGLCVAAFGIGALLTIFLPLWTWILAFASILIIVGVMWLLC